jgi:hypothetical protein
MAGEATPVLAQKSWPQRAVRMVGSFVLTAVFGFGLVTALALVTVGGVLFVGSDHTHLGVAVTLIGVIAGLGYAAAQGALD